MPSGDFFWTTGLYGGMQQIANQQAMQELNAYRSRLGGYEPGDWNNYFSRPLTAIEQEQARNDFESQLRRYGEMIAPLPAAEPKRSEADQSYRDTDAAHMRYCQHCGAPQRGFWAWCEGHPKLAGAMLFVALAAAFLAGLRL